VLKRLKFFIIFILLSLLNISIANGMILDEKYSNNSNETILEVLNKNIDKSYSISLLAIKNLEDTKNINIQIDKLKYILNNDLIKNIERILNSSSADSEIINSALNLDILINSISDKIDMILGGASPIAMAFYSEEIVNIFDEIYNGIDKNNNNIIEYNLGEGCLNYLNSISVNNK
tara:strand:- start:8 stop:535 length:528 start_codon:yes stop_codon:yes gene_type:complete